VSIRLRPHPTGRDPATEVAEFAPHGEYALLYPFMTAMLTAATTITCNGAELKIPPATPTPTAASPEPHRPTARAPEGSRVRSPEPMLTIESLVRCDAWHRGQRLLHFELFCLHLCGRATIAAQAGAQTRAPVSAS
jgi:hypothetical protein